MVKSIHDSEGQVDRGLALERLMGLALHLADLMDQGVAANGLTRARAGVIWHLYRHGPAFQRELSQALGVTPRNVTGLVDALEATGFVARSPHPTDRRATVVSLTNQGQSAAAVMQAGRDRFAAELFGHISSSDVRQFVGVLDQLMDVVGTGED